MSFRDCITSAMADGHISREAGDDYITRYDEFVEDGIGRLPFHESQARAAQRLQGEIERKIRRKKRMRVKQALAIDRIKARLTPGQVEKAAVAVLDFDPKLEHVGDNITMRHESTRGTAFALMSDFVDRFRSKHGGLTRETAGMDDVVAGLFGESTTPAARAFADAVGEARIFLVGRHNKAGGDIVKRKDWGWVQRHDRARIAAVSKEEWVEFTRDRIDQSRMLNADG